VIAAKYDEIPGILKRGYSFSGERGEKGNSYISLNQFVFENQ